MARVLDSADPVVARLGEPQRAGCIHRHAADRRSRRGKTVDPVVSPVRVEIGHPGGFTAGHPDAPGRVAGKRSWLRDGIGYLEIEPGLILWVESTQVLPRGEPESSTGVQSDLPDVVARTWEREADNLAVGQPQPTKPPVFPFSEPHEPARVDLNAGDLAIAGRKSDLFYVTGRRVEPAQAAARSLDEPRPPRSSKARSLGLLPGVGTR